VEPAPIIGPQSTTSGSAQPTSEENMTVYPPPAFDAKSKIECNGAPTPEIVEELRTRALDTRGCYEKALFQDRKLAGRMAVRLRIEESADVVRAAIENDAVGNASLRWCIVAVFLRKLSSPPAGGCVDVLVPLNFKPKQPADAGPDSGR
jgi:hypothetical protein